MSGLIQVPVYADDAAASTATTRYLAFGDVYRLKSCAIVNNGAIAADNTNYAVITIYGNDGATAAFQWSTQDTAEGALVDGESESLVNQNSGLERYAAGTSVKIAITKQGSGKQLDCSLLLQFELDRTY